MKSHQWGAVRQRLRAGGAALLLVGAVVAGTSSAASAATSPGSTGRASTSVPGLGVSAPVDSLYWGAVIGSQFTGDSAPYDYQAVTDFQNDDALGKTSSIVPLYEPFADCSSSPCTGYAFPAGVAATIRAHGAIPMISWGSSSLQDGETGIGDDPTFSLAAVADGRFDAYLTAYAEQVKAWGEPFFLRFDWEMNGNWFDWGQNTNANTPAQFVAAWRHVHDIFASVGATNATWVWCPNVNQSDTDADLAALYPGDAYVDWTCMDGYNFGGDYGAGWESWDQVAQSTYDQITQQIAPAKPMMIGEFNSAANSVFGSQALWLAHTLEEIPLSYPQIHAVVLFDAGSMAIENAPGSVPAFAAAINNPAYAAGAYGDLGAGPIPAP